ncbi:MAG: tRNA preQ1(34) S-adenosylmethionine ribosyltransferase-isomerase QueA [Candidatus Caldatribacteriaceae bacterium]
MTELKDFDFHLPPELIAQEPVSPRDSCRLMVLHREKREIKHRIFWDIIEYLKPGDVLVFNDSKVLPARLFARKEHTGGKVEILFLARREGLWECLLSSSRLRPGQILVLQEAPQVRWEIRGRNEKVWFLSPLFPIEETEDVLFHFGHTPTPPYVKRRDTPLELYQTVYARVPGSVAAPTAGLHFTESLLGALVEKGVESVMLTLHVGFGTFSPIRAERVENHRMHEEWFSLSSGGAEKIRRAKERGKRVVAVGTTTVRALESIAKKLGRVEACEGTTDLFIYPGFSFQVVDALITNFHLPRSTLLLLVCAFAGTDFIKRAYEEAIQKRYRFYSFGDAMLIL